MCVIAEYFPICSLRPLGVALDFYIVIFLRPFLSSVDVVVIYRDRIAIIHYGVVRITCVHVAIIIDIVDRVGDLTRCSYHSIVSVGGPHRHRRFRA